MGQWGELTVIGASPTLCAKISGSSSGVERKLPKLDVAGSIPVSRSTIRLANWVGRIFISSKGIAVGVISIYLYR